MCEPLPARRMSDALTTTEGPISTTTKEVDS
jgi:hypothetical protein